ncbi:flagellar FlbD family protein [Sinomonas albida]|uniref:flagellar FlbD family protein n=1 Tax=Sinomonas albida TaxID=369942 RepID=UPI0010A7DF5C|nr:flagellar FlbD family protein [Sinomonas albida]
MIVVTRLNGSRFAVNPDLIERIQENPDTTLVMVEGTTYVVRESLAEVIGLIADYRALVLATARGLPAVEGQRLSLVPRPPEDGADDEPDGEPDDGGAPHSGAGDGGAGDGGARGPGAATPLRPGQR